MASHISIGNPRGLARPAGTYSHVARSTAREFIFIAGQVAVNSRGRLVGAGDFDAQARQVFRNLRIALKSAGADFRHVVQFTTYLVNSRDIAGLRRFRVRNFPAWFPDGRYPPNTLLVVDRLASEDWLIEVAAIAALA